MDGPGTVRVTSVHGDTLIYGGEVIGMVIHG